MLLKVAVFGVTMSIMATILITVLISGSGDYAYAEIEEYRDNLIEFSGETMVNETPWVLTGVYTPWYDDAPVQIDDDGWLYGQNITDYPYLNKSAGIKLDSGQKSSMLLTVGDDVGYSRVVGKQWWAGGNPLGLPLVDSDNWLLPDVVKNWIATKEWKTESVTASNWNYTGYRYVFDPTLPFSTGAASKDGALSIVWYSFDGAEGLSGGLEVYGGKSKQVKLASYAASDIVNAYNTTSGYASTYDFNFEGINLTLSIKFDPEVINSGMPLYEAWTKGLWSMAISSASAGNFYDVDNSTSFTATAGNVIQTFMDIYTFNVPSIDNPWMDTVLWLIVGLPMSIAMMCIALRLLSGVMKVF